MTRSSWWERALRARIAAGRLLAFGSLVRAGAVVYLGRGPLAVEPRDPRGRFVVEARGVTQPNVAAAWLAGLRTLRPTVAVDIGANYGEISLLGRYPEGQQCVLVEANPVVADVLQRSVNMHLSRARLSIARYAATAGDEDEVVLYVDPQWSGTSSLAASDGAIARCVSAATVDDLVASHAGAGHQRVVVKIDVEGAERAVLQGARRLLCEASALALIVECNDEALSRFGGSATELLRALRELGDVYRVTSNGLLRPLVERPVDRKLDVVVLRCDRRMLRKFRVLCFVRAACGG